MIALSGYQESPEVQALTEWNEFLGQYDMDHEIADEIGNGIFQVEGREDWSLYGVYSFEMGEKLDEIVDKYSLKLHNEINFIDQNELIYRVGGSFIDEEYRGGAYIYEDGTFHFDSDIELSGYGMAGFQFRRTVKGTFDATVLNIGTVEDYTEWQYVSVCGEPVLLAMGENQSLILGDFEDCFIVINVLAGVDNGLTEEDLQELADKIDFSILKAVHVPDMRGDSAAEKENSSFDATNDRNDSIITSAANIYFVEQATTLDQATDNEESEAVITDISKLPVEDYAVLLAENEAGTAMVYGYESDEYGLRGILVRYGEQEGYFDYCWYGASGYMELYEGDYDNDGTNELCLCMSGPRGTGISIERLILIEKTMGSNRLSALEFAGEVQQEEIKNNLNFGINVDSNELVVQKKDGLEEVIFQLMPENLAKDKVLGMDCFNQIDFYFQDDKIYMDIDIGVLLNNVEPTFYLSDENGIISFEVMYFGNNFSLK